jgi:threonine/homoserine/homoserine lactone efflux protein
MGLMMVLVPLGLGAIVLAHPLVLKALNWGGAFLLWLSWKIAISARIESAREGRPVGCLGAAVFQWINPKSWTASLGGLFALAAPPSCFVWLAFGAAVQRLLHSRRRLRIFNIAMGTLLALSMIALIVS